MPSAWFIVRLHNLMGCTVKSAGILRDEQPVFAEKREGRLTALTPTLAADKRIECAEANGSGRELTKEGSRVAFGR